MSKVRIAIVNSHPIQYFAPLYAYLNASPQLQISALYCSDFSLRGGNDPGFQRAVKWDIDLLAGYEAVFLGKQAASRTPGRFFSLIAPQVWSEIRSGKYDVLMLHGHNYAAYMIAFAAAKTMRMPVMMRAETHLGLERPGLKRFLRKVLLGTLYRNIDRFLAIGSANRDFYRAMGVPEDRIFSVPYSVDNERFMRAAELDGSAREEVRTRFGLPAGKPVVLFASKLMRRKHPDDLLRAAAALQAKGADFSLLFVGSGEMENEVRSLAVELGVRDVVFAGFVNQSELPRVYSAVDVFVLPSENEPWGLVVNEVMCAGLPLVIADGVGCARDLVVDGENGYTYRAGDVGELASALEKLIRSAEVRESMGRASRRRIMGWGYRQCLEGLCAAVSTLRRRIPGAANAGQPTLRP